jgi:hypothetical protein
LVELFWVLAFPFQPLAPILYTIGITLLLHLLKIFMERVHSVILKRLSDHLPVASQRNSDG